MGLGTSVRIERRNEGKTFRSESIEYGCLETEDSHEHKLGTFVRVKRTDRVPLR